MEDDLEQEFRMVATAAVLSRDADEAAQHVRQLARRVAQKVAADSAQPNAKHRAIDRAFREFMAQHAEDLLDDPEILKRVQAREQVLMRENPQMPDVQRWHRAANDVRERYGTADQRVIRGMRQQRLGARLASDPESYTFDTGSEDVFDNPVEAEEAQIAADRVEAIARMKISNMGQEITVDKARYNEMELRRRQRYNER